MGLPPPCHWADHEPEPLDQREPRIAAGNRAKLSA